MKDSNMKVLHVYRPTCKVSYKGYEFDVPVGFRFMAVDRNGELKAFRKEPKMLEDRFVSTESTIFKGIVHIAQVKLPKGSWEYSCEQVMGY